MRVRFSLLDLKALSWGERDRALSCLLEDKKMLKVKNRKRKRLLKPVKVKGKLRMFMPPTGLPKMCDVKDVKVK